MAIAVINYIRASNQEAFERIVRAFKNRAGMVETVDGFISLQVLANRDRLEVLVITTWRDRESFEAWVDSEAFKRAHERARGSGSGSQSTGVIYEVVDMKVASPP